MRVCCGSRRGRCVHFTNILDSLMVPCLVYNTAMYTVYGRCGQYGRCMFIHWLVQCVVYTDIYICTVYISGSCNHDIFLCLANLQNCSLLVHVFSISTRGALQIQDRSPQLRLVSSECVCDWWRNATGLDCGDRSWICNTSQLRLFSTTGLILNGNHLCLLAPDKLNTISFIHDNHTYLLNSDSEWTESSLI